jgi:hypothetical protein
MKELINSMKIILEIKRTKSLRVMFPTSKDPLMPPELSKAVEALAQIFARF